MTEAPDRRTDSQLDKPASRVEHPAQHPGSGVYLALGPKVQPHEFCNHFGNAIRVQLDWKQFCSSNWLIEHNDVVIPAASANLYTPWYALANGDPCDFDTTGAQPQSVLAAAQNKALLSRHHVRTGIADTGLLLLPAYRLNKDSVLLLDGNHRVVATHVSDHELPLALFVICGPMAATVLPDLQHWV